MKIKYNQIRQYKFQSKTCAKSNVCFYNFWEQPVEQIWFYSFIKSRKILERSKKKIHFFSCLGNKNLYTIDKLFHPINTVRVFFSGENLHRKEYSNFENYYLDSEVDLALGFDSLESDRYLRFPIWICEVIPPSADRETIKKVCDSMSHQKYSEDRSRFCAMVASGDISQIEQNDSLKLRKNMVDTLQTIASIDCAGRFMNNTDMLKRDFNDDKSEFLKRFQFFICPENTDCEGYVTEKIFHSIQSGCVPIYSGASGNPEPDVINKYAVIFWDDNTPSKVEELYHNKLEYREFFEQPRLMPNAAEYIADLLNELEQRMLKIIK